VNIQTHSRLVPTVKGETRIEVAHGLQGFLAMQREWDALFTRCGKPQQVFQSHLLLSLWAKAYGELARGVVVIAAYTDDQLVAALPLVRSSRMGLTSLRLMGTRIAQFDDMLLDNRYGAEVLDGIWRAVETLGADFLEARRVREDSALWNFSPQDARIFERLEAPFACLATRVGDEGPGSAYSAKDRSNHRRRLRRLGERGMLTMNAQAPGPKAVPLAMEAIAMKRRFLRRIGVMTSAVYAPEFASFFAGAAADPASGLLVSAIEIDGRPVAIDLSFLCKGTGFGHVLATEPEFEREAIGSLLVHHVFEQAQRAGAKTFDLLAPADSYKMRHADAATPVESRIYPLSMRGRIAATAYMHGLPVARSGARLIAKWRDRRSPPAA
jgi:CelD/BcsL family acetyltransferase involved in cellulose biosynthesis